MNRPNRDLLVLFKGKSMSDQAIEREVDQLNKMLFTVESPDNLCVCCEVLDMNKRKIMRAKRQVDPILREKNRKPFVFINILN